ncbi:hypothetical protein ACWCQZ_41070 [Streptomyces sp. NPDC002285]
MSARDTIKIALTRYYRSTSDPLGTAVKVLDGYDADRREYLLNGRSDVRDRMRREAYTAGMQAASRTGRLRDFTPVFTTSDGSDVPATELRCVLCAGLIQGVGPHTLLDLTALAAKHECGNNGGHRG